MTPSGPVAARLIAGRAPGLPLLDVVLVAERLALSGSAGLALRETHKVRDLLGSQEERRSSSAKRCIACLGQRVTEQAGRAPSLGEEARPLLVQEPEELAVAWA